MFPLVGVFFPEEQQKEEKEEEEPLAGKDEEERRIAEMGRPMLGDHVKLEIIIEESYEFKVTTRLFQASVYFVSFCLNGSRHRCVSICDPRVAPTNQAVSHKPSVCTQASVCTHSKQQHNLCLRHCAAPTHALKTSPDVITLHDVCALAFVCVCVRVRANAVFAAALTRTDRLLIRGSSSSSTPQFAALFSRFSHSKVSDCMCV